MNTSATPESHEIVAPTLPCSGPRLLIFSTVSFFALFYWFAERESIIRLLPHGENVNYLYRVSPESELLIGLLGPVFLAYIASVVLVFGEHVSTSTRILIFVAALFGFATTFLFLEFLNSEF